MKNQQQQEQEQYQETMGLLDSKKNPNLETIHKHHHSSKIASEEQRAMPPSPPPPPPPQHFKTTHHQNHIHPSKKTNKNEGLTIKNTNLEVTKKLNSLSCNPTLVAPEGDTSAPPTPPEVALAVMEESGRERLKRHRAEMAGRVRIPDIWGHEDLLKDWIDCTVFDSTLGNNSIMSARAALVQERRSNLRIENQC